MKPLLCTFVRLYPAAWRKRYGAEFKALIEDARPGIGGAFDILKGALTMQLSSWTPLRILAGFAITGTLIGSAFVFTVSDRWTSSSLIRLKMQPSNQFGTIQSVMSDGTLNELASRLDLHRDDPEATNRMRRAITVSLVADELGGPAIRLQFTDEDPKRAQQVIEALTTRYIESEPETFQLVDAPNLPTQPTLDPLFHVKFASVGLGGGLLIGAPAALVLYWRRRK